MATGISWADETWNPFVGCKPVSPACVNCYAQDMAARLVMMAASKGHLSHYATAVRQTPKGPAWTGHIARAGLDARFAPFKWGRPRTIFPGSMTDFFHPAAPDEWRIEALAVMALTPRHHYLPLTKRAADMRNFMTGRAIPGRIWDIAAKIAIERDLCLTKIEDMQVGAWPLPNVALGVTAEDQTRADERIPDLLATPAAKRFVSCEPLLGPIDLERLGTLDVLRFALPDVVCREERDNPKLNISGMQIEALGRPRQATIFYQTPDHMGGFAIRFPRPFPRLDWVIAGGESGKDARPSHPDWFRALRDQCAAAGVPFHFKQWGEYGPCELHGPHPIVPYSVIMPDGRHLTGGAMLDHPSEQNAEIIRRFGTHRAGHLLDGVEHRARLPWSAEP